MELRGYAQDQYLVRATRFLERCRHTAPLGGMWDVADVHWWWRDGGYEHPERQLLLEDGESDAVQAMVLLSEAYATFDYEVSPGLEETGVGLQAFAAGLRWLRGLQSSSRRLAPVTFFVREDHGAFRRAAAAQGYESLERGYEQLALDLEGVALSEPPANAPVRVRCIEDTDFQAGEPPVIRTPARNFARVSQAPLYRRDQHLVAVDSENRVMAECIYWVDRANGIGVFEPVETAPGSRRRGAARALLAEGIRRMKTQGVKTAKVSHYNDNLAARRLYHSLGFTQRFTRVVYGRG